MNESTADLTKEETISEAGKIMLENCLSQVPKHEPTQNVTDGQTREEGTPRPENGQGR